MTSVVDLVASVLGELRRVIEVDQQRCGSLHSGLLFIRDEMAMVNAEIEDSSKKTEYQGAVQERRLRQLEELAYDIEDFVEGLWKPGTCGRVLLVAAGLDPRSPQLQMIDSFKERIKNLKDWRSNAADESSEGGDDAAAPHGAVESDPEVIDGPKKKLVELILSPASPADLRVISIVGCRGVGKTALARALYSDHHVRSQFECVAWFNASGRKDLLSMPSEREEMQTAQTTVPDNLSAIPADKKFLIFIDDVREPKVFKATVGALRRSDTRSRIIVTTSVRSVAHACSSGSYVYTMRCLGKDDSRKLFWRKVYGTERKPSPAVENGSESIFSKCDGLPLALDSTAKDLSTEGEHLEGSHCKEAGQNLGKDEGMQKALLRCYDKLLDYDHRACLLHLSTFPRGHRIKSKCLVRRLMAEGLVAKAQDGRACLNKLTDHCIVDPVQPCSDSRDAKRYGFHGLVLECIIQEAASKNAVTLIREGGILKGHHQSSTGSGASGPRIRRLSVQSKTQETCDLSAVRSVTIFDSDFDFQSCKILRLLDLEGCTWIGDTYLGNSYLDSICEMPLLKYLSLRGTGINELPNQIKKLQRLETLDVRETGMIQLSIEAIMLPKLAYLFGKFVLTAPTEEELPKLNEFLKKKSELQAVSGFVVNEQNQGPGLHILSARKLKKVKVWSNDASPDASSSNLCPPKKPRWLPINWGGGSRCRNHRVQDQPSDSLGFIRLLKERFISLESVSIDSSYGLCEDFLLSLGGPCTISSIKLRGKLDGLPHPRTLSQLGHIRMLQLFSTGLSSEDLSALQKLRCLEYLKLAEDGDRFCNGSFIVEEKGFPSLKRLCIEAPKLPHLQFKGVMENLISLHLLCPYSVECIMGILNLTNLNEVVLHMCDEAMRAWEEIANGHPSRPWVKKQAA